MSDQPYLLLLVGSAARAVPDTRFRVHHATSGEMEFWLRERPVDAVLVWLEQHTPDLADRIREWKRLRPTAQFVLVLDQAPSTRAPSTQAIVGLLHAGCHDVVDARESPDLIPVLESLAERIRFVRIGQMERLQARQSVEYTGLVGESPELIRVFDQMRRAAELNCPVLVAGETGTGKGLVAQAIHALGRRSDKPFVTVDCGCLAPTLIESELYGATRGAYTGATVDRGGLVQAAQEGTLFLDEIGELALGMQPKLLRLLEEGEVRRLGSQRATAVDVRVISATSRQLEDMIAADQFRLDLYYRLNVLAIELPPLRARPRDVPLLARHFASLHLVAGEPVTVSALAIDELAHYNWPGNVRELKNCIEAAVASLDGNTIHPQHLPRRCRPGAQTSAAPSDSVNLEELERRAIARALELTGHDKARAARLLGIGKTTLYRKLKPGPRYLM